MDVAQTTQLIYLMLNSVLMMNACALLLAGLLSRQTVVRDRVQSVSREFIASIPLGAVPRNGKTVALKEPRQFLLKKQLRQMHQRLRAASNSVLAVSYALLLFVASTLMLALRALVNLNGLIPIALGLFSVGVGILLMGIVLMLYDLHMSDRSLWQEVKELLGAARNSNEAKSGLRLQSPATTPEITQTTARNQPRAKAKAG
jgi:small-conductance mechanosensitive channel